MKKTTYTTLFSLLVTTALSPVYSMEKQEQERSQSLAVAQKTDAGLKCSSRKQQALRLTSLQTSF